MIISILILDRNFWNIMRYRDTSHFSNELRVSGEVTALVGNALAVFLAQYSIIMVSLLWHLRKLWIKLFITFSLGLNYYCIMFLFSRSGYLATLVGWLFLGFIKDRRILIGLFIFILFWQALLPVAVKERIEMTKTEEGFDSTSSQRFDMWEIALGIISNSPIFGAGLNFTQHFSVKLDDYNYTWHSFHNAYLQTAVELGLVGLGIFLLIFFFAIRAGWRLYKKTNSGFYKGIGLGLMGCTFACMAGNLAGTYWHYQNVMGFFWVLLALVNRSSIIIEQQKITEGITSDEQPFEINDGDIYYGYE